jgi:hypothetical protein
MIVALATDKSLANRELVQRARPHCYKRITQRAPARQIKAVRAKALAQRVTSGPPPTRVNERTLVA